MNPERRPTPAPTKALPSRKSRRLGSGLVASALLAIGLLSPSRASAQQAIASDCNFGFQDFYNRGDQVCVTGNVAGKPPGLNHICPEGYVYVIPAGSANPFADVTAGGANFISSCLIGGQFFDEPVWLPPLATGTYELVLDAYPYKSFGPEDYRGPGFTVTSDPIVNHVDVAAIKEAAKKGVEAMEYAHRLTKALELIDALSTANDYIECFGLAGGVIAGGIYVAGQFGIDIATSYDSGVIIIGNKIIDGFAEPAREHYQSIVDDPPDANFMTLVPLVMKDQAALASLLYPASSNPIPSGQVKIGQLIAVQDGALQALLPTIEKLQGAQNANDSLGVLLQSEQAEHYIDMTTGAGEQLLAAIASLRNTMQANGTLTKQPDPAQVASDFARVVASGFTDKETAQLQSYGLTLAQIATVRQQFASIVIPAQLDYGTLLTQLSSSYTSVKPALLDLRNQVEAMRAETAQKAFRPNPTAQVADAGGTTGQPVTLSATGTGYDPNGTLTFAWDVTGTGNFTDGAGTTLSYTPSKPGRFPIGVKVTDQDGHTALAYGTLTVTAANGAPEVTAFSPKDVSPFAKVNDVLAFTVGATDPDNDPVTYQWTVDGQAKGTGTSFSYKMLDDQPHTVKAIASDNNALTPDSVVTWSVRAYKWTALITGSCQGIADGTACSDGNACTTGETCHAGACNGGVAKSCAAGDQCHGAGVCDPNSGACTNPALADGSACSDGNACTTTDTCQGGTCTGGAAIICNAKDQCHVAGSCDPNSGICTNPAAANGTGCNDGNLCTQGDVCTGGSCAGTAVSCAAGDQCHLNGVCDPKTGQCANPNKSDGTACSDGNACTQFDACIAGTCTGNNPVTCAPPSQCQTGGNCNPNSGACVYAPAADGSACSDGNSCTLTDICKAGTCTGTNPVTCQTLGKNCGQVPDGCGATLNCGNCPNNETCGGGGVANVCGGAGCIPATCGSLNKNCGQVPDGCGGTLTCGACGAGQTCGGGGVSNVCGCSPTTCQKQGVLCGNIADGCGGSLDCGPCTPDSTYTTSSQFDTGTLNSVNHNVPDQLQLNTSSGVEPFIYVANWIDGTVLKINTDTGRQVARYDSALYANWDGTQNNIRPVREYGSFGCPGGQAPSRTAVDGNGDAFVSNRAFCWYPSVTKFAGSIANCVDRNGNGVIDTSNDANGDGLVNINDPAEFKGQSDECILFTKNTLSFEDFGRSLTIDSQGDFWVGGFNSGRMERRSGQDGHLMQVINTGIVGMYGLALGPNNIIYNSDINSGHIAKIDPSKPAGQEIVAQRYVGYGTYGIAVDKNSVVWLGDWTGPGGVVRVDFNNNTSGLFGACAGGYCGYSRGVAVDGNGNVWVSVYYGNQIIKFDPAGNVLATYGVDSGPIGVGVDGRGNIWTANQGGRSVTRVNPANGSTQTFTTNPGYYDSQSYSYSDMTGFQQRNFVAPQGDWTVIKDAGPSGLAGTWWSVSWNGEPQGSVPPTTQITAQVRAADTQIGLAAVPYQTVQSGVDFRGLGIKGRFVQVKMTLRILSGTVSPILSDVTIKAPIPANNPPVAACQNITVAADGNCQGAASINNGSFDPDQGDSVTCTQSKNGPFGLGTTSLTLTCTDTHGASASCTGSVTVVDFAPPKLVCPVDTTLQCVDGGALASYPAGTATDNCGGNVAVACTPPMGSALALGSNAGKCTATDGSGNTASCNFILTVANLPPVVKVHNLNLVADAGCQASGSVNAGSFDPDGGKVTCTQSPAGPFGLGSTLVTVTCTDSCGGSNSATATVTVVDATPPVVMCPGDETLECTNGGAIASFMPSATDNCGAVKTKCAPVSSSFFVEGATPDNCVATDGAGNTATCSFNVIVQDTKPPVITCPAGSKTECTGNASANVVPASAQATDQCTTPTVSGPAAGSYPLGTTSVTYTAKDKDNHAASCQTTITVVDTTPPSITCPGPVTAECQGMTQAVVVPGKASASDLCTSATVAGPSTGSYPLGTTTVDYSATDTSGNVASCESTINVVDTTPPKIVCPAPIVAECAGANTTVTAGVATASDTCGPTKVSGPTGAASYPLGTTTLSYGATDEVGNPASCSTTVTVKDTKPPVVTVGDGSGSAQVSLWPPNHALQTIDVSASCNLVITDTCQGKIDIAKSKLGITCVTSDEDVLVLGSGNKGPDIIIVDATHVQLRSERAGGSDGRVYRIGFSVTDAQGNVATGTCRIDAVKSQNGTPAIDSGAKYKVCR